MSTKQNDEEQLARRATFNEVARLYDRIRPGYPAALIADVVGLAALPADGRILEIGCGTGQATLPFAQRGYAITCVELGEQMAALATETCRAYPNVHIVNSSFEDWSAAGQTFDLVMSATAFHWIPREIGYPKAAQLLQPAGHLAVFSNVHPKPFTGFFDAVQQVYQQVVPKWGSPRDEPSTEQEIEATVAYINGTGLFEPVLVRAYPWTHDYTAVEYCALLNTYSDHRSLAPDKRARLHEGMRALIERDYGGTVTKPYLTVLYLAQKAHVQG